MVDEGKRFTHVYRPRGEPTSDGVRMRHRLASLTRSIDDFGDGFGSEISQEIGVTVPSAIYGYNWIEYFALCDLTDLLDTITVGFKFLTHKRTRGMRNPNAAQRWLDETRRIFAEENLRYRIDNFGGVHFAIDDEFESNRFMSIAALNGPRYENVAAEFEETYRRLAETPPNCKYAIRSCFAATEGLFRVMFPDAPRLTAQEIDKRLGPFLQKHNAADPCSQGATSKLLGSFKSWVDAAHFYRHEAGNEEVVQPSLPLAINIVSVGATFIRWLAEFDATAKNS